VREEGEERLETGGAAEPEPTAGLRSEAEALARARTEARDNADRLRVALEATGLGTWDVDPQTREIVWDARCREILGVGPTERIDPKLFLSRVHEEDREKVVQATRDALAPDGDNIYAVEYRVALADGGERWVSARGRAFVENGIATRYIGTVLDITERKQAERRQRLLTAEVDHRAKNMLAVVQAILRLTRADTVPEFVTIAQGRIGALTRAHTILARGRWEGASLTELAEEELRELGGGRAAVRGPAVTLAPAGVQPLAMVLHELATNALRHGALRAQGGRVELDWTLDAAGDLTLTWRESGGPPVAPPAAEGLGLTLAGHTVRHQLNGTFELDWRLEGLKVLLRLPVDMLVRASD